MALQGGGIHDGEREGEYWTLILTSPAAALLVWTPFKQHSSFTEVGIHSHTLYILSARALHRPTSEGDHSYQGSARVEQGGVEHGRSVGELGLQTLAVWRQSIGCAVNV